MTASTNGQFSVVLAAGGSGARFAAGTPSKTPKQFLELSGRPIFIWSLTTLLKCDAVSHVVIVVPPDMVPHVEQQVTKLSERPPDKTVLVTAGGATRQESVFLGLQALEQHAPQYVLVHDAARPFLNKEVLDRIIAGVIKYGACTTAIPASDTIKRVEEMQVVETINRESLYMMQTPQGGRFDWLLAAHHSAANGKKVTTDDAAILELAGHAVSIVDGATYNLKITTSDDLILAEAMSSIVFKDRL